MDDFNNPEKEMKLMEQWRNFKIGDIVTRIGTDRQEIIEKNESGDLITVKCIKASHDGAHKIGDIEANIPWRYDLIKAI